ncbi:hypothetical protein GCM10025867_21960 [Frondihabitans sucicola]|uniref:DUF4760 domain-containing protein n=1 Tax=Frondihabitans sucicola TaxID=1268041 RepID=A0ABM8GNC8_9MICO|nr:hypothetical protein [Frondihabitans sucicola]BDZ49955.1 hypothetical protein GCM10025867_21960 [Frondihabitans sucicola]
MKWWNAFVDWLSSSEGSRIVTDAILPFVAVLLAGVLAALIARGMILRVLELCEREAKASAVTSLIGSARRAVDWSELYADERAHATHLADEASVRLRLLPVAGAGMAASWAEHEISTIKANSATFRFQAEQTFSDVRDRLVEWQAKPARARKLFRYDLDRWKVEGDAAVESADAAGAAPISRPSGPAPTAFVAEDGSATAAPAAASAAIPVVSETTTATPTTAAVPTATASGSAPSGEATPTLSGGLAEPAPAAAAAAAAAPSDAGTTESPASGTAAPEAAAAAPTARAQTGMVTPPVVQPSPSIAPSSPSDAPDSEARDDDDREPAYSAPVSAQQVRRRTSPDAADSQ